MERVRELTIDAIRHDPSRYFTDIWREVDVGFYFVMDPGTHIRASRGGVVLAAEEDRMLSTTDYHELHQINRVTILHWDLSYAVYQHLFPSVKLGQFVRAGDPLGTLGGWDPQWHPHLHLHFFQWQYELYGITELALPKL